MMNKGAMHKDKLKKYLTSGVYATYYFVFRRETVEENEFIVSNPDLNLAIELWNMLENNYI